MLPRIGALREVKFLLILLIATFFPQDYSFFGFPYNLLFEIMQMNLEYFPVDSQVRQRNLLQALCCSTGITCFVPNRGQWSRKFMIIYSSGSDPHILTSLD